MRIGHGHSWHLARGDGVSGLKGRLEVVDDFEINWSLGKLILHFLNLGHFLVKRKSILPGRRLNLRLNI